MVIFKNPRDSLGISTLARQMYPNVPYGYLLLELHQLTPENMRLRTNIYQTNDRLCTSNVHKRQFRTNPNHFSNHVEESESQSPVLASSCKV
jgi:hypothetical protein